MGANSESTTQVLQFYHLDRLGSRLVTNASDGSTAGEQESLPFGTALGAGIGGNNRRFTSYDRSTTTKLDYAVNRSYNAGLGRFTQVDPIGMGAASPGDPQSFNLYAYCQNDPINHLDPDGLDGGASLVIFVIIPAVAAVLRAIFSGGSRAKTAPIVKRITYRQHGQVSNRAIWTRAGIQAGVGAVSQFIGSDGDEDGISCSPECVYKSNTTEKLGVGQPGTLESFIPIWGSGRAAIDDYQNGRYGWAAFNTVMAISDVFLVKSIANVGIKIIQKGATKVLYKTGSHTWPATQAWAKRYEVLGYKGRPNELHHWLLQRNQGIGKNAPDWLKNQPWNLINVDTATHQFIHYDANLIQKAIYGTPQWVKTVGASFGGRVVEGVAR